MAENPIPSKTRPSIVNLTESGIKSQGEFPTNSIESDIRAKPKITIARFETHLVYSEMIGICNTKMSDGMANIRPFWLVV